MMCYKVTHPTFVFVCIVFPVECGAAQGDVRLQTEGCPARDGETDPAEEQFVDQGPGHSRPNSGQQKVENVVTAMDMVQWEDLLIIQHMFM